LTLGAASSLKSMSWAMSLSRAACRRPRAMREEPRRSTSSWCVWHSHESVPRLRASQRKVPAWPAANLLRQLSPNRPEAVPAHPGSVSMRPDGSAAGCAGKSVMVAMAPILQRTSSGTSASGSGGSAAGGLGMRAVARGGSGVSAVRSRSFGGCLGGPPGELEGVPARQQKLSFPFLALGHVGHTIQFHDR
jgi:hypothetical protein